MSSREFVTLSNFERFADGSGYSATIDVAAGNFSCRNYKLYFERFTDFVERVLSGFKNLEGVAELGHRYEPDWVRIEFKSRGHVIVSGLLGAASPDGCKLQFAIEADQTFLGPFIKQLELVSNALH